jgi:hypothetical protein
VLTTWTGLLTAYRVDLPANPTIIGLSCLLLLGVALVRTALTASHRHGRKANVESL